MIKPSCTREGKKIREKREKNVIAVSRSCRFHITSKTTCRGIRCSSVLRSSAFKFFAEKINQIVVTLCSVSVLRDETLIFASFEKPQRRNQSCVLFVQLLFCISKIPNRDDCFLWNILFNKKTVTISSTLKILIPLS